MIAHDPMRAGAEVMLGLRCLAGIAVIGGAAQRMAGLLRDAYTAGRLAHRSSLTIKNNDHKRSHLHIEIQQPYSQACWMWERLLSSITLHE